MNLFVHDSKLLEFNVFTNQAIHNATVYWLSVGYVIFIFIWLVSVSAIIMREYISFNIRILQNEGCGFAER